MRRNGRDPDKHLAARFIAAHIGKCIQITGERYMADENSSPTNQVVAVSCYKRNASLCIVAASGLFMNNFMSNFSFVLLLGDRSDDRKRPDATRDRSKSAAGNCFASANEQGKFACIGKVFR